MFLLLAVCVLINTLLTLVLSVGMVLLALGAPVWLVASAGCAVMIGSMAALNPVLHVINSIDTDYILKPKDGEHD